SEKCECLGRAGISNCRSDCDIEIWRVDAPAVDVGQGRSRYLRHYLTRYSSPPEFRAKPVPIRTIPSDTVAGVQRDKRSAGKCGFTRRPRLPPTKHDEHQKHEHREDRRLRRQTDGRRCNEKEKDQHPDSAGANLAQEVATEQKQGSKKGDAGNDPITQDERYPEALDAEIEAVETLQRRDLIRVRHEQKFVPGEVTEKLEHLDARAGAALVVDEAFEKAREEAGFGKHDDGNRNDRNEDQRRQNRRLIEASAAQNPKSALHREHGEDRQQYDGRGAPAEDDHRRSIDEKTYGGDRLRQIVGPADGHRQEICAGQTGIRERMAKQRRG